MASTASEGPRYAPEDPTLPKPWKGLVDGSTGYLYYWNPETNITTYDRPGGSSGRGGRSRTPPKTASAPISSSVHVHQSSHGHHRSSRHDDDGRHRHDDDARHRHDDDARHRHDDDVRHRHDDDLRRRHDDDLRHGQSSNGGPKLAPIPAGRNHQSSRGGGHLDDVQNGSVSGGHGGTGTYNRGQTSQALRSSTKAHGSDTGMGTMESYRRQHEITVSGDDVPPPFTSFESTGFPTEILSEVHHAGFSAPTPIQAQTWPIALQGRDIVAIAKTGSGKTLGYLIPGFIHLKHSRNNSRLGPTVLVLSPTRELATQIQVEAVKFSRSSRISCTCLYGGAPKGPQLRELERGADIVVATPGRLNDILEMRKISLRQVSYLVLDEADRMLDMGFEPQIRKIVNEIPPRRQTLMYTATWPKEVRKIAADLLDSPIQVNIGNINELVANKSITQHIEVVSPMEKNRRLEQILRSQEPGAKVIIFCSTKKMCDQLTRTVTRQFGAAAIHGDKSQGERDYVLNQFRTGRCPILVATDVAARGLDIKDIRVVINYDFPTGIEDYVHRIGRTGRAGATGISYTFFCEQDAKYASDLIKVLEGANQRVPAQIHDMASRGGGMGRTRRQWGSASGGRDGGRGGRNDYTFGGRSGRGLPPSSGRFDRGYGGRGSDLETRERFGRSYNDGPNIDSHDRYHRGYNASGTDNRNGDRDRIHRSRTLSRSRSPTRGDKWGYNRSRSRSRSLNRDRSRSRSRSCSRSLDRYNGPPKVRKQSPVPRNASPNFHRSMDQGRSPPPQQPRGPLYHREKSPLCERSQSPFDGRKNTYDVAQHHRTRSPYRGVNNGRSANPHHVEEEEEGLIPAEEEEGLIPEEEPDVLN